MNPNRFLALALFVWLAAAPASEACAQWVQMNGLYAGQITQLAASQTKLFAEVSPIYGVFYSTDLGLSWPYENYCRLIGSTGTNIYAVLDSEGVAQQVYTWSESGATWIQIGTILTTDSIISVGGNDSNLFMGATNNIYRSTNRGIKWETINPFSNNITTQNSSISGFAFIDSFVFAGISNIDFGEPEKSGILRSSDNGDHWILLDSINDNLNVNCLFAEGGELFSGTNRRIFLSSDFGITWESRNVGIDSADIYCVTLIDSMLMAGSSSGFYISTNDGLTWASRSIGLPQSSIMSICRIGATLFSGTASNGIYSSIDSGQHWMPSNPRLAPESPLSFLDWGESLCCIGENLETNINGATLFRSSDSGMDWYVASDCLPGTLSNIVFSLGPKSPIVSIGSNLYVGSYELFMSSDSGSTWVSISNGLPNDYITCLAVQGTNMFAGTLDSGIFVSKDSGITWMNANQGKMSTLAFTTMQVLGYHVIAGSSVGGIFVTSDGGDTWEELDSGLTDHQVLALASAEPYIFAGTPSGFFRSSVTTNDLIWSRVDGNRFPTSPSQLISSGNTLFASLENGLYFSTDYGENWVASDWNTLNSNPIVSLFASDGMLFIGLMSSGGDTTPTIWRRPLSDFGISAVSEAPPVSDAIRSYPNPFSQSTEIAFTSATAGYANVSVVNILGAPVAHLFSGELPAGEHDFAWDAQGMALGSYWCTIRMNGSVETLPLTLLRQ